MSGRGIGHGSLRRVWDGFIGRLNSGQMDRNEYEQFQRCVSQKIKAAERLALDAELSTENYNDVTLILGAGVRRPPRPKEVSKPQAIPCGQNVVRLPIIHRPPPAKTP